MCLLSEAREDVLGKELLPFSQCIFDDKRQEKGNMLTTITVAKLEAEDNRSRPCIVNISRDHEFSELAALPDITHKRVE